MSKPSTKKTGLAFSGGGVRSAALCSGVLRRLLQKGVSIDYLSSVSGGGYTAASYMDWKFRNEQKDDPAWHKEYFEHLRKHINLVCDCSNPCRGFADALMIISIVIIVSFVLPWVNAYTFAIPTAYLVDHFFGDILRAPFTCPQEDTHNFTASQFAENQNTKVMLNTSEVIECVPEFGPQMYKTIRLFAVELIAFLLCYYLQYVMKNRSMTYFLRLLCNFTGFVLAMTFLPWIIEQYIVVTPLWVNVVIIVLSIFIWLGFPPLRGKASIAMIVYVYAYAVKWQVYKTAILGFEYTYDRFWIMLWLCGFLLWINPFVGSLQKNAVHLYMAWRLQKTFFSPESTRLPGNSCADTIVCCCCCRQSTRESINKPITLADLVDVQPELKCNVTVNNWRKTGAERENNYEILTLSPTVIERIDRGKEEKEFESQGFVKPNDVTLSSAMATSAAAVSYYLGKMDSINKSFRDLQIMLGLGLGKTLIAQPRYQNKRCKVVPLFVQFILAIPILGIPVARYCGAGEIWDKVGAITFVSMNVFLTLVAMIPTGARHPGCLEKLARWSAINIYHVRIVRSIMGITNIGPTPPPVLDLSDGGHVENLGLLPLFKLRLPRIVAVNGGAIEPGHTYASDLIAALKQAREKLRCSFTGVSGRDIQEDIRHEFVEKAIGKQPRCYRFKVTYYEKSGFVGNKVGEGEVLLLMPRHPDDGISQFKGYKWSGLDGDVKLDLDESTWGSGPALKASEVNRLSGCCFECCHWKPFNYILNPLMGRFPLHSTVNQMFTASQFSAYHREGYRACLEGETAKFLEE